MSRIYFLEKILDNFNPDEGDLVIALTAQVSFELEELGVVFINPEEIKYPEEIHIPFVLRWMKSQNVDPIFFQASADTMKAAVYWVWFLEELDIDDTWIWYGYDPPKFPIFKRVFDNYVKSRMKRRKEKECLIY